MATEVPRKDYKVTSPVTVDGMKQNRLTAIGSGDKTRRKELLLIHFGSEQLKTLLLGQRTKPAVTSTNPSGYSKRKLIFDINGNEVTSLEDDIFLYMHNQERLYLLVTTCVSNDIQFLCPSATSSNNGVAL